jgi:hypothetical protein
MAGIFPNETTVYIVNANVNGSALATSDRVIGEITNWTQSGMDRETESIPVIGGFVDKEQPRSQGEISFDIIVANTSTTTLDRWNNMAMSTGKSDAEPVDKAVFIYATNGTTSTTLGINNANITSMERKMDADDMLRFSITMKFSPTTSLGVSNLRTSSVAYSSSFFTWI